MIFHDFPWFFHTCTLAASDILQYLLEYFWNDQHVTKSGPSDPVSITKIFRRYKKLMVVFRFSDVFGYIWINYCFLSNINWYITNNWWIHNWLIRYLMIFIIHRSWEYFRGTLPGTFPGTFAYNMLVGPSYEHVGRPRWSNLFREPFRGPLGLFRNISGWVENLIKRAIN